MTPVSIEPPRHRDMPVELYGCRRADPANVAHLSRVLRSGCFIRLYDGIAKAIITAVSINGNELAVMLCTQLWVHLCKELLACLGAFS